MYQHRLGSDKHILWLWLQPHVDVKGFTSELKDVERRDKGTRTGSEYDLHSVSDLGTHIDLLKAFK